MLSQAFNNRSFSNTGFSCKNRIIFCAARQNLYYTVNFLITTNDRIIFILA